MIVGFSRAAFSQGLMIVALALAGCRSLPAIPASATDAERSAFVVTWIDDVLARQQNPGAAGVAVIVVHDGQVILSRAKGMADRARAKPITEATLFEIASLSKPITAIAVMQLVEQGRLRLDDRLGSLLPQAPAAWGEVTVRQLLSQQSGLPDFADVKPAAFAQLDGLDNRQILQRYAGHDALVFAPGSAAQYANINYLLLAEVIEAVSGETYAHYLHRHIFAPAGMLATFVHGDALPDNLALNFAVDRKPYGAVVATLGPTGIYSSVTDLARLIDSLLDGKLVQPETLRIMTQAQSDHLIGRDSYGFGFFVRPGDSPMTRFMHGGELDGYRSFLGVNYPQRVHYIVLTNGGRPTRAVMEKITAIIQRAYDHDGSGKH